MISKAKNGKLYYESWPGKYEIGQVITLCTINITAFSDEDLAAMGRRDRIRAEAGLHGPSAGKRFHEFVVEGIGQTFVTADGLEQCRYYGVERFREERNEEQS